MDIKDSVEAIGTISGIINQINDISATIASAVEQNATTNEMSRNVTEAARSSGEITKNISGVAGGRKAPRARRHWCVCFLVRRS
jgi:methyl-accepting chemotaxis protein